MLNRVIAMGSVVLVGACLYGCTGEVGGVARGSESKGPDRPGATEVSEGGITLQSQPAGLVMLSAVQRQRSLEAIFPGASVPASADPSSPEFGLHWEGALGRTQVASAGTVESHYGVIDGLLASYDDDALAAVFGYACARGADDGCVAPAVSALLERAWRRPPTADETARYVAIVHAAEMDLEAGTGLRFAVQAALMSPNFNYRTELGSEESPAELLPHELAAKVSYLLGDGPPSAQFTEAVRGGALSDPEQALAALENEGLLDGVGPRMVGELFSAQRLLGRQFTPAKFPDVNAALLKSMATEVEQLSAEYAASGASFLGIFAADHTFVDRALAKHYGMNEPAADWEKTPWPADQGRLGILSTAAFLAGTSKPERHSITTRGNFLLTRVLCEVVPPPPDDPGVQALAPRGDTTLREWSEAVQAQPSCKGCHTRFDPLAFPLEHFDAVGRYRTHETVQLAEGGSTEVEIHSDATPTQFEGAINDAKELGSRLAEDPRVEACMAQHIHNFARGWSGDSAAATKDSMHVLFREEGFELRRTFARLLSHPAFVALHQNEEDAE